MKFELPPESYFPEPPTRSLSAKQLHTLSRDQLVTFLHGEGQAGGITLPMQNAITAELLRRGPPPHWSAVPSFWLLIVSVGVAVLALWVAYLSLQAQRSSPPAPTAATSSPTPRPR